MLERHRMQAHGATAPRRTPALAVTAALLAGLGALLALMAGSAAAAVTVPNGFSVKTFGGPPNGRTGPDDIAWFGGHVFVGFQNGVGSDGSPSAKGTTQSTLVEYDQDGHIINTWDLTGKADGVGADPAHDRVVVTANEDKNSRLYTVDPDAPAGAQVTPFTYSPDPGATGTGGVHTGGGTDAVTVYHGDIFLTASNPNDGTPAAGPNPSATAVFEVSLDPSTRIATLSPTFADNSTATNGNRGGSTTLNLTDPDSNAVVPGTSPRFGGDFVVDGQADNQLVFADRFDSGGSPALLTALNLTHGGAPAGVDDVRWAENNGGTLYVVDHGANDVLAITGPFDAGHAFASLDHVGSTPMTTELDSVNLATGALTPFATGLNTSKGLLYVPPSSGDQGQGNGDQSADQSASGVSPGSTEGSGTGNEPATSGSEPGSDRTPAASGRAGTRAVHARKRHRRRHGGRSSRRHHRRHR